MTEFHPDKNLPNKKEVFFSKGQKINIELMDGSISEHEVLNVLDSCKVAAHLGFKYEIKSPVPVLILNRMIPGEGIAHYHPKLNVILAYNDTTPEVMLHEIIHSLEMQKLLSEKLKEFYQKVLLVIPDKVNIRPNFHKDIHEFIADAYSKPTVIKLLKDVGLYEEFERLTKYIFE